MLITLYSYFTVTYQSSTLKSHMWSNKDEKYSQLDNILHNRRHLGSTVLAARVLRLRRMKDLRGRSRVTGVQEAGA